jgi:23S rRNA pseudouridine2605 synthase
LRKQRQQRTARVGLARAISKAGYCSRSQASEFIHAGRVRVNGQLVRNSERPVAIGKDKLQVDGLELKSVDKVYLMLNKPRGIVTTSADEKGRQTVYSLLPRSLQWIAPVGRLDKASDGLLLFSNDSAWAAKITNPKSHVEKTYHVQIASLADQTLLDRLLTGCRTDEGGFLRVKRVALIRSGKKNSWLEIVLDEGKNRHIRRLLQALGIDVLRLVRIAIGPVKLGDLAKGAIRALTQKEISALTPH